MMPAEKWQSPHVVFLHSCIFSHLQAPQQCGQIRICIPWSGKMGIKPRLGHCWHTSPFWAATVNLRSQGCCSCCHQDEEEGGSSGHSWQECPICSLLAAALLPTHLLFIRLFVAFGNWFLGWCPELTLYRVTCRLLVALQAVDTCFRSSRAFLVTSFQYNFCQHR